MKIRPLADKVIVERIEAENKTAGGIVLPDSAKEKPQRGKVISVGEGKLLEDGSRSKMQVKKENCSTTAQKAKCRLKKAMRCSLQAMPARRSSSTAKST